MKVRDILQGLGNSAQYIMMALQTDEILKYIELGLSILTTLIILGFNLWSWWKKASKDGKITEDEIQEGIEIVEKGAEDIKDNVDKNKGE